MFGRRLSYIVICLWTVTKSNVDFFVTKCRLGEVVADNAHFVEITPRVPRVCIQSRLFYNKYVVCGALFGKWSWIDK